MDQTKTASSKEANGSSGTSRTLDPAGHSQQLPLDTEPAPRPNASQPSQPTASKSTLTPIPTPDVPNGGKGGSLQPVKNKTPVITSSQVSADSNAHLASQSPAAPAKDTPPVKDTPPQADIKQKNTAGTTAKSKSAQAPGGLPELERIEQKYLGLRQLVAPSDEMEEIEADIVFVHGIAAHPHGTWTHKDTKVNWLEDKSMLPADLPKARILYFGYQSAWYGQNAVRQTVNTAADQLLNSLMGRLRENCAERPIIFVAHCFGGLIVQRAFHIAHSHRSNFPGLIDAITGLIFLGTPHSGVDGNSALSTQGDIYQAIVSAQVNTHVETLEAMTHNNQMLHGIVQDFNTVLKNEVKVKPQIYSFYEMYSSNVGKIGGMGNIPQEFVVTESSATLYGYGSTGLNANHFNMNTFENNQDANYDSVRQQIMKMAKQSRENQEQRKEADTKFRQSHSNLAHFAKLPIPIRNDGHFADRGDILDLLDRKFHDENGVVVALVGGLGTGKTHIAVEYANRYCIENPGAYIHWIDASSAEQFEFSYKRIAEALQIRLRDPNSPQEIVRDVYQALKKGVNSHWLMVVDGLNDESSLHWAKDTDTDDERTIWDFIPMGKHASVLVTTRNERLARRFVRRKHQFIVEVNPLGDKDAAFMVLGEHTSNKRKFAQAKELAKQLGGIAGALAYVYAYLTKVDRKMELKAYGDMLKLPESSKPDPIANAVLAWRSLYRALKTKHPEAANLLNSVGVLDVQSIPKDFFQKTDWKLTRTLEAYGMIERSADDRFIRVTGIVRLCLQRYLEERGKKEGVEEKVLEQLCENLKGGHQDLDDALLPSILAALNFQAKSPDSDTKKLAATLHLKVAQYYQHIGRLQAAIRHFEHCLTPRPKDSKRPYFISNEDADSAKKALEQARSDVKKAESSAVSLTKGTKKPALPTVSVPNPREIHTELQHLEKTSGPSHASTIQKVAELAALRLTHPGIRHVNKVNSGNKFADTRGLPAPPGRSPLIPAAHIPPAHAIPVHGTSSAQGRSAAYNSPAASPQPHSPRALSPTVASLPGTHKSSDKLPSGSDHPHQPAPESDDTPEEGPASLYHRLLTTAISHGRDNMHTANAHYSLAIAHESQGDFPQSQTHFFHALSTARTHVGIDSPEYLRMMRALACGYARKGGDYLPQAQQIFAFVLQKQVKTLGETHPETLVTRHNVALFLEEAEEWEAAGEELERILGLQGYLLGRDSQDTLQTACSLAMNYGARGKRKEALELFRATLVTQERVLGETHVDTVTTAERLREFLAEMNVE